MSGATARENRRALRRAFGPQAVASLSDGSAKIRHIDGGLSELAKALESQRLAVVNLLELRCRGFWGRLWWLVTGH